MPFNVSCYVVLCCAVLCCAVQAFAVESRIRCPRLERLRWRVDVVISSGSLSRVMRPSVLLQVSQSVSQCSVSQSVSQ